MINWKDALKVFIIAAVLSAFILMVGKISSLHGREEAQMVRDAVHRATLTCYAVEGAYPESLDYLKEHYQLAYDENRFFVTYDAFAINMMPDIYVVERGAKAK